VRKYFLALLLLALLFVFPNNTFGATFPNPKECTWDSAKCSDTETCVYKGLTRYLDCVNAPWDSAMRPGSTKRYGICSYGSQHGDKCTDEDVDATCLNGPFQEGVSREIDQLRDFSLCEPLGTSPSFPVPSSSAICAMTPAEGIANNTYFTFTLTGMQSDILLQTLMAIL